MRSYHACAFGCSRLKIVFFFFFLSLSVSTLDVQQNCEMGIFTEIKRAWLAVDSTIYLWSYDNGCDMAYYDGLTEVIIGVALLKPKPGKC